MTPSLAALLGRWFWWPLNVRQRPVPQAFASSDAKKRQLPLWEDKDSADTTELPPRR
jgi:RND superfamily putative drug exporter